MKRSPYDPLTLLERAELWRAEAATATIEEMRAFCLAEAIRCETRVQKSQLTPVFRETLDDLENSGGHNSAVSGTGAGAAER